MPSLQAIQNYFNEIYKTANNLGGKFGNAAADQSDAQATAIQQCYGINQVKNTIGKGFGCILPGVGIEGPYTEITVNNIPYCIITGNATINITFTVNLKYFAVGGGGDSGTLNGGGAGGLQTNIPDIAKFPSQYNSAPLTLSANEYSVTIGNDGGNTTLSGPGVSVIALGGAYGGATSRYCPAPSGGCGGGGCPSVGLQGGSSSGPNGSAVSNAGGGIGGNVTNYTVGGPGISFLGKMYGVGGNMSPMAYGRANTGGGGSNGGKGGSGVFIISL
jgi:hypothetical protein